MVAEQNPTSVHVMADLNDSSKPAQVEETKGGQCPSSAQIIESVQQQPPKEAE